MLKTIVGLLVACYPLLTLVGLTIKETTISSKTVVGLLIACYPAIILVALIMVSGSEAIIWVNYALIQILFMGLGLAIRWLLKGK